jgi:hypothetical protein
MKWTVGWTNANATAEEAEELRKRANKSDAAYMTTFPKKTTEIFSQPQPLLPGAFAAF